MTTNNYLSLSALGGDRSGLVAQVTHFVTERGGNIEDSRMAVLGAEFGILMLISGGQESIERIEADAPLLEKDARVGLLLRRTRSPEEHRRAASVPCAVTAEALDHEGIVRAVTTAIANMGINIVSLETSAYHAPITGSQLFRLQATVDLPRGLSMSDLRSRLDEVAREENLDVSVRSLI